MKSNYFTPGSKTSQIRVKREKPKKKQVNWDRTVYLLVLILVVTMFTRYMLSRTYFVTGEGQVISEVVDIRSPDDIDIRMIRVRPGDIVERGDTLFSFSFIDWQERQAEIDRVNQRIADLRFELADARERVYLKGEEIRTLENRIQFLEREREAFQERVRLNISTVFELNAINRDLFDARSKLELTISEERVLRNLIDRMEERVELFLDHYYQVAQTIETRYFVSQLGGRVDNVYKKGSSQAFRSEEILTLIPDQSDVYVLSVFNRKDTRYLDRGAMMNIEFDNGERSQGIIAQSYEARDDLLRHFRQTGTITSDYLIVELMPYDETTRDIWRMRHRSGLKISKPRYFNLIESISSAFGLAVANRSSHLDEVDLDQLAGLDEEIEKIRMEKMEVPRDKTDCRPVQDNSDVWNSRQTSRTETLTTNRVLETINANESVERAAEESLTKIIEGHTINLYSFTDLESAREKAGLIDTELCVFICQAETGSGSVVWRVSAGQFENSQDARHEAAGLFQPQGISFFITGLNENRCQRFLTE